MDAEGFGNDQEDRGQGDQECNEFNDPVIPFDNFQKIPPFLTGGKGFQERTMKTASGYTRILKRGEKNFLPIIVCRIGSEICMGKATGIFPSTLSM